MKDFFEPNEDDLLAKEARKHKVWRIFTALGLLALMILAGLGIKGIITPPPAPQIVQQSGHAAPVELPDSVNIDLVAASDTAQAIARAYLTLDETGTRQGRLEQHWNNAGSAGWNGQGKLALAGNAYTVSTQVIDKNNVLITVAVYANVNADKGLGGWIGVKVPIQMTDGHASAAGTPRIVGLPPASEVPKGEATVVDSELSTKTRPDIEAFFTAYAAGDVSAVVAPGAKITAPRPLGTLTVNDWKITSGTGDTRQGAAVVTWQINGAALQQTYTLQLSKVTSSSGEKWQVLEVK